MMTGLLSVMLSLCMAVNVHAASFDCAKASTKVEKMICDNPEISMLDDELSASYKTALQDEQQAESIRQAQKQWLKERNRCADADCVKRVYVARLQALSLAPVKSDSKPKQKPRFTVTQGKGWTICESYANFLNTLPESEALPLCHLKLSPDFPDLKEPDWEELDIPGHLELVYAMEKLTSPCRHDRPVDNFEHWKAVFEQQVRSGDAFPRLRRVRLALIDGGPVETILAYEPDRDSCDKAFKQYKGNYVGAWSRTSLFLWDEQGQKITEYRSHTTFFLAQELLLFQGKPFCFWPWGDGMSPDRTSFTGDIHVSYFKHIPGDATPYANLDCCRIGFELTPETFKRMIK
jgi:uncharacterized protein